MGRYFENKGIKIKMPYGVEKILSVLTENGYEAYAVGGCVRDAILGKTPGDWDITTSAPPSKVKSLFKRTFDTGILHGTVTVMIKDKGYEVTTYRLDGYYEDHRHPSGVTFTSNLIEDLKRRDFTINAMAYNSDTGLVDEFCGLEDLKTGVIRCVGDPKKRFNEDALRLLRALRFSAQLGFIIEDETKKAITSMAEEISNVSAERIRQELEKLIMSDHPDRLLLAQNLGLTKEILPEFDEMVFCNQNTPYHCYSVAEHTIKVIENVPKDRTLRFAALLHDVAKPKVVTTDPDGRTHFKGHAKMGSVMSEKIMRRLKMDNKTIKTVSRLVACHDDRPASKERSPKAVRYSVSKIGKDIYPMYLSLAYADLQGKSEYGKEHGYDEYLYEKQQFENIMNKNICTSIGELSISGDDLIRLGCEKGESVGKLLGLLLDMVLTNPDINDNFLLSKEAKKIIDMWNENDRRQKNQE